MITRIEKVTTNSGRGGIKIYFSSYCNTSTMVNQSNSIILDEDEVYKLYNFLTGTYFTGTYFTGTSYGFGGNGKANYE